MSSQAAHPGLARAQQAVRAGDAAGLRRLLAEVPGLRESLEAPAGDFATPLMCSVRSRAVLDVLLEAGADINARSQWWAGGFGLLDFADADLAAYALERGAALTVHAAARLGWLGQLRELLAAEPGLVHARGGDGQTPLHFAASVEIAACLLEAGAELNARDVDHESTPAQYMIGQRQPVARFLIARGAATDLLAAAALGDLDLAPRLLAADPEAIRMRVSDEWFPMVGSRCGGTIYQWELGWHVSSVQVARKFGHAAMFDFLTARCPPEEALLNACWLHDAAHVDALLAREPMLAARLSAAGQRQLAHAARNNDTAAARLMLRAGLPVDNYSQHHATALHWAAWHGNAELARLLLERHPPLDDRTNDYQGTAADWAVHGSQNGWQPEQADGAATLDLLLAAGVALPEGERGTEAVKKVLAHYRSR